jgi:hypothetical protein
MDRRENLGRPTEAALLRRLQSRRVLPFINVGLGIDLAGLLEKSILLGSRRQFCCVLFKARFLFD